ncbi:2Fe-2S iron-sulfur cluster-binding protein [Acidisoma sp.]|uniref:2Fe-2S iron-sulfur cluster-binding protein n=1 Tax=Acidisoma sp. TaxID=1872115 RepID=UPI003B006CF4
MPDGVLTIRLGEAEGASVKAECGETLLAALMRAETGIRHICGGRCACGTCRIAIAPDWIGRLPAPSRNEARLLGVLPGGTPAHRLACQITLDEQTDGLAFRLDTPVNRRTAASPSTKAMETNP